MNLIFFAPCFTPGPLYFDFVFAVELSCCFLKGATLLTLPAKYSCRQRSIEVTLAASRLGASIVSKSGGGAGGRSVGPWLSFERVSAAEYLQSSGPSMREASGGGGVAEGWDRYAVDEDGAHVC
jgi:hypothetical protein